MDKTILFVQSEETALGKDLVSFHKSFKLNFNQEVISRTHLTKGMYANIVSVNKAKRTIRIMFSEEKLDAESRCRIPHCERSHVFQSVQIPVNKNDPAYLESRPVSAWCIQV